MIRHLSLSHSFLFININIVCIFSIHNNLSLVGMSLGKKIVTCYLLILIIDYISSILINNILFLMNNNLFRAL